MEKLGKPLPKYKPHFCIFCKTEVTKISWHFTKKHKNEERIKAIKGLKNKRERFWAWKRLTQEGDYFFNTEINSLKTAKKTVKASNKPSVNNRYYDCPNCMGRLRTTYKNQHRLLCGKVLRQEVESNPEPSANMFDGVPELLINEVRKSRYLSYFLSFVHEEKGEKSRIRTMITLLTELEKALREIRNEKKKSLTFFLKAVYVNDFLKCIKMLCGEKKTNKERLLRNPYRADQLFRIICRMAQFFSVFYEKKNMTSAATDALEFFNKFEADFKNSFKKQVDRAFRVKQCQRTLKLPKTKDLVTLAGKLKDETPTLMTRLRQNKTSADWRDLAENVLCRLVTFDRKPTAAVRMKISDYTSFKSKLATTTEELYATLNEQDRQFLTNIKIIEVNKGNGNIVPVFVKTEMLEAMDVLLEFRNFGNIYSKNNYFFAASKKSVRCLKTTNSLKRYRIYFPKEVRDSLAVQNFFKHAVKMAKKLRFTAAEKKVWSFHMKHFMTVSKKNYSYRDQVKAILIVGRILTALEQGTLKYYKGKKIAHIPFIHRQDDTEKSAETDKRENTSIICYSERVEQNKPEAVVYREENEAMTVIRPEAVYREENEAMTVIRPEAVVYREENEATTVIRPEAVVYREENEATTVIRPEAVYREENEAMTVIRPEAVVYREENEATTVIRPEAVVYREENEATTVIKLNPNRRLANDKATMTDLNTTIVKAKKEPKKKLANDKATMTDLPSLGNGWTDITLVQESEVRRYDNVSTEKPANEEISYDKFSSDDRDYDSDTSSERGPVSINDLINLLYGDASNDEDSADDYDYESNTESEYHTSNKNLYERTPKKSQESSSDYRSSEDDIYNESDGAPYSAIMRSSFVSRTVLVKNNNIEEAMGILNRLMGREGLLDDARRCMYYEKPWQTRKRINFERCKAVYNEEMTRKINFLSRKNRENPYPGCY